MHDESEINYYESLGVAPDASAQEIRDAFHLHVRLLHPDQQTDPQLRELAEKQMRRLNHVYAVLSDPQSRGAYDLALHGIAGAPPIVNTPPVSELRRIAAKTPWAAAILLSTGALIWLAYDVTPSPQNRNADPGTVLANSPAGASRAEPAPVRHTEKAEAASAEIGRLQAALRAAETQRDQALQEVARLRSAADGPQAEAPAASATRPTEPPAASLPVTSAVTAAKIPVPPPVIAGNTPPRAVHPPNHRLAGFWFYAVPADGQQNKNQALYLPEYIEASISEDNGTIHGSYRSRYVIADRAIAPDVNFTLTGTLNGTQCTCQWSGGGGAKGQVTLRLTGDNSMKVDWAATELGSLGLASGTATLTRKLDATN